jgi:hypothetical protein
VFNDRRLLAELRQLEAMKNSLNADAEDPHLQRGTQGRV